MSMPKQAFYNIVGKITTLFCQWLIIMLIPLIGNFDDAGIFSIAISLCSVLDAIATFYIINYQLYDKYDTYSESDYFTFRIFTLTIMVVIGLIAMFLFGYNQKECSIILSYLLYRIIIEFMSLMTARMQIESRLDLVGKCMMIEGIVSFVTFIASYCTLHDLFLSTLVMALFGGSAYMISVSLCFRKVMRRGYDYGKFDISVIKPLLVIGITLMIPQLVMNAIPSISKIGLQFFTNNEITGIFSTLAAPTVIIQVFVGAAFAPYAIKFSEMTKRGMVSEFKKGYVRAVMMILCLGALGVVTSLLCADFFFELIYGDKFHDYIYLFHWLVVAITFMSVAACSITVLAMQNRKKVAVIASIISLFFSLIMFSIMLPSNGIEGTTSALILSNLFFAVITFICIMINIRGDDAINAQKI